MDSGIYKIINTVNGKFYLGSTGGFRDRWKEHLWQLRSNIHHNRHLQFAWNKYGETAFTFEVAEFVSLHSLLVKEQEWLDRTKCYDAKVGYNLSRYADAPMRGRTLSPEACSLLSKSKRGKPKPPGFGKRVAKALTGIKRSKETCDRISASKKGVVAHNKGIPMSKNQKDKLSIARTGKVWLIHTDTHTTCFVDKGGVNNLLLNGWIRCTKKMFRSLKGESAPRE